MSDNPRKDIKALTRRAAVRLVSEVREFEELAKRTPPSPRVDHARIAFKVAALAMIESLDVQSGRTPITEDLNVQAPQ